MLFLPWSAVCARNGETATALRSDTVVEGTASARCWAAACHEARALVQGGLDSERDASHTVVHGAVGSAGAGPAGGWGRGAPETRAGAPRYISARGGQSAESHFTQQMRMGCASSGARSQMGHSHGLVRRTTANEMQCDTCHGRITPGTSHLTCPVCDYDECDACFRVTQS